MDNKKICGISLHSPIRLHLGTREHTPYTMEGANMTLKDVIILWASITPIVQQWEQTISPKHPGQPQPPAPVYDEEDDEP